MIALYLHSQDIEKGLIISPNGARATARGTRPVTIESKKKPAAPKRAQACTIPENGLGKSRTGVPSGIDHDIALRGFRPFRAYFCMG